MPTVFLSYSRDDLQLIEQLEAQLKAHPDIAIWRDQEKIYGGQKWPKVLGEAIADQDVFLLAWSKHSAASHYVEFEWCTAIALKKTIVPCLLDDTPLAPSLKTFHGYRLSDVTGLITSLRGAPLSEAQQREPVIRKLSDITATDEAVVLAQVKDVFTQQQWTVQGNVYQATRDIYIHHASVSSETIKELKTLGITEAALANFFKTLDQKQVAANELDHELREIAKSYLDLKIRVAQFLSEDPAVTELLLEARSAVETVNFPLAEQLFNQASQRDEETAHKLQQVATDRLTSAATAQATNGEVRAIQLDFIKAREYYRKALALLPSTDTEHRGAYLLKLGNVLREAGIRMSGMDIRTLLDEAVDAYHTALSIYTNVMLPQQWAATQNNLGTVLLDQGTRTPSEAGTKLIAQAIEAYKAALTVRTKDTLPQDWAATQNNLGNALRNQGTRTPGEAGTKLIAQAIEAYTAALTVRTKGTLPQGWATTQNNLGNVLGEQGTHTPGDPGTLLLAQAVEAYRAALAVYTKDAFEQQWAMIQNNLGNALRNQGPRTPGEAGTKLIAQAIEAYTAALTVRTKDTLPQGWATTQNNLGNVLRSYGMRSEGETRSRLLAEAQTAYRQALTIRTRNLLPEQWATTSSNLAEALFLSGKFAEAQDLLTTMLQYSDLSPETKVALLIIEIANLVGLGILEHNRQCFDKLQQILGEQIPDFTLRWSFSSIKLFIGQDETFTRDRTLLLRFIESLENKQRDELLTAVNAARTGLLKISKL